MRWLFAPRPVNDAEHAVRTEHLSANAKAYMAYDKLTRHYWLTGQLYREDHELASACGLSVPSFRRVRNLLVRLYDVDESGLWRDPYLEAQRDDAIERIGGAPADYRPDVAAARPAPPDGKPSRSEINRTNARRRWDQRTPMRNADATASEFASDPMRNPMRNDLQNGPVSQPEAIRFASSHLAVSPREEEEDSIKSSSSSSPETSSARDAHASGDANLHPATDAKPQATGSAPDKVVRPAQPVITDRELLDELLRAIGNNVTAECRDLRSIRPVRALMREGCDLQRHILPELRLLAKNSKPLLTWRAPWLHQQIRERRDSGMDESPAAQGAPAKEKVFLEVGSAGYRAWAEYRAQIDRRPFGMELTRGVKKGWLFDAPWPPGYEPPSVAAE